MLPRRTCVTPAQLVDNVDANGEVYFSAGDKMRVISPQARVDYGLAGIFGAGNSDTQVQGEATVRIRSGGSVMPFFAVDGCDYGLQTISDPPPGPATTINVSHAASSEVTNAPDVDSVSPDVVPLDSTNSNPHPTITLTGTGLSTTTEVGFFRNDGSEPFTVGLVAQGDGDVIVPPVTATSVKVKVPQEVLAVEESWYVRVKLSTGKWSKAESDKMGTVRVGSAVLECDSAPSDGNFGTLKLPRTTAPATWLPKNIALGLEEPLSLKKHQGAASPWTCVDGASGAIVSSTSPAVLVPQTNCVDTDTGLADTVATSGIITGGAGFSGRLDVPTTDDCGAQPANRDARWDTGINAPAPAGNYEINDDLLTCFLKSSSTPISALTVEGYTGPPLLNKDIYYSPRFFFMPVLGTEPTCGGCNRYSIIDMRAGFITDQPTYATRSGMELGTSTDHNGISIASNKISQVKVIFFDASALPPPPDDAPDFAYMGAGPKLIKLIN